MLFCVVVLNLVVLCINSLFATKEWDTKFFLLYLFAYYTTTENYQ